MQIRSVRAGSIFALGALLTLAGSAVSMAQTAPRAENSLLGVTLLKSSFRDVLKRFGRPDEIQAGGPFVPDEGSPGGAKASGGGAKGGGPMMGGGPGMMGGPAGMTSGGGPGGGGGGKKATSKTGFLGKSGTGAAGPMGSGGAPGMSSGSGPGGQMMGGGLPGFASGMPGMAGMAGPGGMSGGEGGPTSGMAGPGGASGGAAASEDPAEYEATWWYHDKINGLHKSFLFNKDGRVIQVQEYGYDKNRKGGKTRLGVGLGSGLNQILHMYGWSNDGANDGRNIIMRFGGEEKVAFQLVNNIVVGVTIAVVKDVVPTEAPQ